MPIACRLLCFVVCALISVVKGRVYFGYYGANNTATPWATIYQAVDLEDAQSNWDSHRIPSLVSAYDVFLTSTATNPLVLRPDFGTRWSAFADAAEPLFAQGALLGFNLGDELVRTPHSPLTLPPR